MKNEVLHGLLTARTLFISARRHCAVRDRHIASAGLTILQDAFELVVYCCLLEVGVDQEVALEAFSFDQLIGELRKRRLPILKSGTLKAMNKQRVLIKHHAQLAEPAAVQNYYDAATLAADHLLNHIVGKPLQHIVIADAVADLDLAAHISDATQAIDEGRYLDAMIAVRRTLFLAVEADYDIRDWSDYDPSSLMPHLLMRGMKAPQWTRNREWIRDNVRAPTDYIQLDHERITAEMLEIGINPQEFFNVWRLTPSVYLHPQNGWAIESKPEHEPSATEDNARYCLDVATAICTNLAAHRGLVRSKTHRQLRARLVREEPVRSSAAADAPFEGHTLQNGNIYDVQRIVTGLDGKGEYVQLFEFSNSTNSYSYWNGFIPRDACALEEG